jgi:hypothetical protein
MTEFVPRLLRLPSGASARVPTRAREAVPGTRTLAAGPTSRADPSNAEACLLTPHEVPMIDAPRRDPLDAPPVPAAAATPAAARIRGARWRDTRVVVGALLVVLSVLLGARVVAAADRTVAMPVTTTALSAGMRIDAAATQLRQVRLDGDHPYLVGPVPAGSVALRDLGAGELIPADAVGSAPADPAAVRYVTVPVPSDHVPSGLVAGDLVDVYVAGEAATAGTTPQPAASGAPPARLVAAAVPVEGVPDDGSAFGVAGDTRGVTLVLRQGADVPTQDALQALVATVVAAGRSGEVVLVGVPREAP